MTVEDWPGTPDCLRSCFALAETQRAGLAVGKRILVNRWSPALHGHRGVIVAVGESQRIGEGDCAVLLDEWEHPLGFYWNELELTPR